MRNASEGNGTKGTVERGGRRVNSRVEGQNRGRLVQTMGVRKGCMGWTKWVQEGKTGNLGGGLMRVVKIWCWIGADLRWW